MKKYELLSDYKFQVGKSILYRIKYLKDIPVHNIKKGDFGGWLENESNLSQIDDCVVLNDAAIYGEAEISWNAKVSGNSAEVFGKTKIKGGSWTEGKWNVDMEFNELPIYMMIDKQNYILSPKIKYKSVPYKTLCQPECLIEATKLLKKIGIEKANVSYETYKQIMKIDNLFG